MFGIIKVFHLFSQCILFIRSIKYRLLAKHIGKNFVIASYSIIGAAEKASIGNNVYINSHVSLNAQGGLIIGDDVLIGPYSSIWTSNHRFDSIFLPINQQGDIFKSVTIGNNVWIGANVIILPGVSIGDGSVIGAGSIVTKDIPELSVVVGNPARVIKTRI